MEIVKRAISAFDSRDIESLAPLMTDDHEWFGALRASVEGGSYRGRQGMERYFADAAGTWASFSSVIDEFHDLGDRVLSLGRLEGRGKASGIAVDSPFAMISELRDGKISRTLAYLDQSEAIKAAGLEE